MRCGVYNICVFIISVGEFMKFDIEKMPILPIMPHEDDINEWRAGVINHLESIVEAQDELLKKATEYLQWDDTYNALQQAIKEAKS